MNAHDRARARQARRETDRLLAIDDEVMGRRAPVQAPVTDPGAVDEVERLAYLHVHGFDPVDIDECDDDTYEVHRLLDVAAEGV